MSTPKKRWRLCGRFLGVIYSRCKCEKHIDRIGKRNYDRIIYILKQRKGKYSDWAVCGSYIMIIIVFYTISVVLLLISLVKSREKTKEILKSVAKSLGNIIPKYISLLLAIALVLSYIDEGVISEVIGGSSGLGGIAISGLLGAIVLMPTMIAFPMADMLLKMGAGYAQITMFITTLTCVGIFTLKIERDYLGMKIALLRNVIAFSLAFISSIIVSMIMS